MKLTYAYIFNPNFLDTLFSLIDKSLPMHTALDIARVTKAVKLEQQTVFPVRDALLKEFGVTGFNNDIPILEDSSKLDEFNSKVNEMMSVEFDIPLDKKITLPESIEVTPAQLLSLEPILDF